jgi:hypothetical protein
MRNKKALSEVIGYVLLIVLGISIAGMVGIWLRMQVPQDDTGKLCPEDSSLIIQDYSCRSDGTNRFLNVTIINKGFFTIDGFVLKFNNAPGSKIGIYNLGNETSITSIYGKKMNPEEKYNFEYNLSKNSFTSEGQLTGCSLACQKVYLIELQPFTVYNGEKNYCQKVSYKEISSLKGCY